MILKVVAFDQIHTAPCRRIVALNLSNGPAPCTPLPRHGAGCCFGAALLEGDSTVSLGLILVIILIIFLLGGFSGRFGGYGYGFGHGGVGIIGIILIVVVVLLLMGRL
jgi:hypothetical protein